MDNEDLIKTIDKIYFKNDDEFNLNHLIDNLPSNLTSDYIIEQKGLLEKLLTVVSRKVSELILSHQPAYVNELERIADLQTSITDSIRVCTQGRSFLKFLKDGTAKNGSTIVEHYRKRESLAKLLKPLTAISDLRRSLLEIKNLIINPEDFPKRIQMCSCGKALLASFQQYNCVKELTTKLNDTIELTNNQALSLFNDYHESSMDELRMFLENESWERLPIRDGFKLVQLKEFSFLRSSSPRQAIGRLTVYQISYQSDKIEEIENSNCHLELQRAHIIRTLGNPSPSQPLIPFVKVLQINSYTPDDMLGSTDSDDELDLELDQDFVEENYSSGTESRYLLTRSSGPVLTNSSLNVLRLFGRYIQMMSILEPISYEILMRIYNLLDHYTTVVFRKFGPEKDKKLDENNISPKLKIVVRSIRESLIGVTSTLVERSDDVAKSGDTNLILRQGAPNIANIISNNITSNQVNLDEPIDPKKAVAVESLIFLVNQLWNLQEYMESLISSELRPHLKEQFSQNHSMVPEFLKARANMHCIDSNI